MKRSKYNVNVISKYALPLLTFQLKINKIQLHGDTVIRLHFYQSSFILLQKVTDFSKNNSAPATQTRKI